MNRSRRYVLISPCRDEAQYLRRTLDSVAAQSVPPSLWIVVDDGSTDDTPAILEEYARRLPYLRVLRRTDRGRRQVGPGVVEAFYAGLDTVRLEDFDYLCKLDMDLDLPVRYFELLMQRMEGDPRIGTTSGKPWFVHPQTGELVPVSVYGSRRQLVSEIGENWKFLSSRLTGYAQLAIVFFRLHGLDGDQRYLNAGLNLLDDVAATQDVTSKARPHYGGIKGSLPIYGRYAPLQYPNWATKFFIDALLAKQGALNASDRIPLQLSAG